MDKPEALRLADEWWRKTQSEAGRRNSAYDHYGMDNTPENVDPLGAKMAAELRRLCAENETLKQSVALLQQHHAMAWNRGHTMGMQANADTARRALDAVKQDAWGNTMLTEALLKAEEQRDALLEALKEAAEALEIAADNGGVNFYQYAKEARAAIASAEGKKP